MDRLRSEETSETPTAMVAVTAVWAISSRRPFEQSSIAAAACLRRRLAPQDPSPAPRRTISLAGMVTLITGPETPRIAQDQHRESSLCAVPALN